MRVMENVQDLVTPRQITDTIDFVHQSLASEPQPTVVLKILKDCSNSLGFLTDPQLHLCIKKPAQATSIKINFQNLQRSLHHFSTINRHFSVRRLSANPTPIIISHFWTNCQPKNLSYRVSSEKKSRLQRRILPHRPRIKIGCRDEMHLAQIGMLE